MIFSYPTLDVNHSNPINVAVNQSQEQKRQSTKVDEILTIESNHWYEDLSSGKTVFEGNVKAKYGLTELVTEKLVIDKNEGTIHAVEPAKIIDPEGQVVAEQVKINWKSAEGTAMNVRVEIGYVLIQGENLIIQNNPEARWVINGAQVELTDLASGGNRFFAEELTVLPGKRAIAKRIHYQVFGQKIGPFPSQTFNLDKRITGFKFPSVSYSADSGFSFSWNSSLLVSQNSVVTGRWKSTPGNNQEYQLQFTHSFVNQDQSRVRIDPFNDLGERFANGWFNNVDVRTSEDELIRLSDRRSNLTLNTSWNQETKGRIPEFGDVSKAYELVYEQGGQLGSGGWIGTARFQRIRESQSSPWIERGVLNATFLAPQLEIAPNTFTHSRFDLGFTGLGSSAFSFTRLEVGIIGSFGTGLTIGGAYVLAHESGTPDFTFDRLAYTDGLHLRADYLKGPYKLRFLTKYDFNGKKWYDNEWEFALAAGSLEPYISHRQFPNELKFGVRLRVDQLINRIQNRELDRKNRPAK